MPLEFSFEPRSPRYGPFLVLGRRDKCCAHFGPFLAIFGPFLGSIAELEGKKGLFVTSKSGCTFSVETSFLPLAVLTGFCGCFGPQKAVLGRKMQSFAKAPPDLVPPPQGPSDEFLAENLFLARPPPRLQDG